MFFVLATSPCRAQVDVVEGQLIDTQSIASRDGSDIKAEYWRLSVPENRANAATRMISLAFVRIRSPHSDVGEPVFFLAGGPGGSSIRQVKRMVEGGGNRFFDLIGGDIVGIDQRGVGMSEPNLQSNARYGFSLTEPGDRAVRLARIEEVCRKEAKRWRDEGVDLDGYTTVESADDVEAVRHSLGYEKIVLWGGSYGSHLAMATLRRHEAHIARALLTAPEGPNHTHKLPSYAQDGLERIGKLVAADLTIGKEIPDMVNMLRTILSRLEASPVYVMVDGQRVGISKFDVQQQIALRIGTMRDGGDQIPAAIKSMADGHFEEIARELLRERQSDGVRSAMSMMMDCSSGATAERSAQIARERTACLLEDYADPPYPTLAKAWDAPDLGDAFRGPLRSNVPILFIVGNLDSRTPIRNAEELMVDLPNSNLVIVENAGHNDVPMGMPALRALWGDFLKTGKARSTTITGPSIRFRRPEDIAIKPDGAVDVGVDDLAACAGEYRFENGMVMEFRVGEGRLIATIPGKGYFDIWPSSATEYFSEVREIPKLTFVQDDSGKVVSLRGGNKVADRLRNNSGVDFANMSESELDEFTGKYDYGDLGILTVSRRGKRLISQFPGQRRLTLRPVSKTELRWLQIDARLLLTRDATGKIVSGEHHQNNKTLKVTKR